MMVGDRLKKLRKDNGMTQQMLADMVGVNVQTIRSYESGKYEPSRDVERRLEKIFGVRLGWFETDDVLDTECEFCVLFELHASAFKLIRYCPVCGSAIKKP